MLDVGRLHKRAKCMHKVLCPAMELTLCTPLVSCLQRAAFFRMHSVHNGKTSFRNIGSLERLKCRSQRMILSRLNKSQVLLGGSVFTQWYSPPHSRGDSGLQHRDNNRVSGQDFVYMIFSFGPHQNTARASPHLQWERIAWLSIRKPGVLTFPI